MNKLQQWAKNNCVSSGALRELTEILEESTDTKVPPTHLRTETDAQNEVRLKASQSGARVWRNNTGVAFTKEGTPVRFGLSNDSKQVNSRVKSSDLIGLTPVVITRDLVGCVMGQFVAREMKCPGWVYAGTPKETAQKRFIDIVRSMGGDASFSTGVW